MQAHERAAQRQWDRVRAAAKKLDRLQPGAGAGLLERAGRTLDLFLTRELSGSSGVSTPPDGRRGR